MAPSSMLVCKATGLAKHAWVRRCNGHFAASVATGRAQVSFAREMKILMASRLEHLLDAHEARPHFQHSQQRGTVEDVQVRV